jgi:hypothetical protein
VPSGGDEPDPAVNPKFAHKLAFLDEMADWIPIPCAIAPPRVEFFFPRHKVAQRIDPWPRRAHQIELFDLDRRVTDDPQQGLVISPAMIAPDPPIHRGRRLDHV